MHTNDFINNMSHEFKTPLSNISLAAKMIVKQNLSNNEQKIQHYTDIILDENEKLNQQINAVLNLNALERDEVLVNKKLCNFHQLIDMAIKNMYMQIEHNNAKVDVRFNAQNFNVIGDKFQLVAVVCNLIDNALKYANNEAFIKIETLNNKQKLVIVVSDHGIGIPNEYHQKVFEKYFRVPDNDIHKVKGFGLGLAYIKKIVEMHQGNIHLNSQLAKGTTFIITLPYV
jgi:two-component system phosphate regulon sensor histidine kinase PhoR